MSHHVFLVSVSLLLLPPPFYFSRFSWHLAAAAAFIFDFDVYPRGAVDVRCSVGRTITVLYLHFLDPPTCPLLDCLGLPLVTCGVIGCPLGYHRQGLSQTGDSLL